MLNLRCPPSTSWRYLGSCQAPSTQHAWPVPGCSPAVVQASQWTQDVSQLRQWLDDVELSGGCNQPVAFGEALLEAAALLELPTALALAPGAPPVQGHCLVCMVSDPASTAVPWPYASAYGKVRAGRPRVRDPVRAGTSCVA